MICSDLTGSIDAQPDPVWPAILAGLWLTALPAVARFSRSPRRRPAALLLLSVSGAATLSGYGMRRSLDAATGIPDGSILAGHLLGVAGVAAVLELAAALTGAGAPTRRGLRAAQLLLAVGAFSLTALFVPVPRELDHPDFGCWQASSPLVVTYELLYQACLATGLAVAGSLVRPRVRTAGTRLHRGALRLIVGGCATGLAYVAVRCWYLLAHGFALPYPLSGPYLGTVPVLLLESALALFGSGLLIPAAYRSAVFLRRLVRYHRLRPLWALLDRAAPGHVLGRARSPLAEVLDVRGIERKLYRRTIEIRDAQWELAGYVSPAMADAAATGLRATRRPPGTDTRPATEAVLEAVLLELALRAKPAGLPCTGAPESAPWTGEADLDTEARALLTLRRLRDDPWVRGAAESVLPVLPTLPTTQGPV
ncbi:MAB_1171c family putative transporter [Kitasatospora sp. NPDC056446]|uniref:MAB_1171c family putative transporter n=1 Tax=Kitasatospora sp. NPDC056446 TaxID=3345819 RepID=UPI00368B0DA4